jgi:hypothetical protein
VGSFSALLLGTARSDPDEAEESSHKWCIHSCFGRCQICYLDLFYLESFVFIWVENAGYFVILGWLCALSYGFLGM